MTSKIDQIANAGLPAQTSRNGAGAAAANGGSRAGAVSDSVRLTGDAERVAAAERALSSVQSDLDVARIQALRDALAAGEYRVDAAKVADAMSTMELLLGPGK